MEYNKSIKALVGAKSLLLIFSNEAADKLNIANQEWLTYEVRNNEIVIKKIADVKRSLKSNDMREEEIGTTLPSYLKDSPFNTALYTPQVRVQYKRGEKNDKKLYFRYK
jgi:hypothetical protein